MICPRCKNAMREQKRSFHKQRKWVCPHCGRVRMQSTRADSKKERRTPPE